LFKILLGGKYAETPTIEK